MQKLMPKYLDKDKIGTYIGEENDEIDFASNFSGTSIETWPYGKKWSHIYNIYDRPKFRSMIPTPENSLRIKTIHEVLINGNKIKLLEPIQLNIKFRNQYYILYNEDLKLSAINNRLDMAISEIQEEFSFIWNSYVTCPEEELTEGAKRFRNKLKRMVDEL